MLAAFTVTVATDNDTVNGDPGSLRLAIIDSNKAPGANTIAFDIPGGGVQTIKLNADLPQITVPVAIDGYTQPGAHPNTMAAGDDAVLEIVVDGTNASVGFNVAAGGTTISGLVIDNFAENAIELRTKGGDVVSGDFIGVNAAGTAKAPNGGTGVAILDPSADVVGGSTPADRNIISGNGAAGVNVDKNDMTASAPGAAPRRPTRWPATTSAPTSPGPSRWATRRRASGWRIRRVTWSSTTSSPAAGRRASRSVSGPTTTSSRAMTSAPT